MGEVFLAEHPLIGKSVALKVIHQDLSVNNEVVTRFINEAKAVSTIGNEHIVDVHDFGVSPEGAHFFIMEYLAGETLTMRARQSAFDVATSLHIAAQIAAGLAAAHDAGIVHRDLKPDNIMLIEKLGDPTFVKILDFGLAKMLEAGDKLTAMGVVLGTPEFMSPEAAESKSVDGRSDVYSLGVLLFQMLTGQLPFTAKSMGKIMVQHVCRPPPVPRSLNPEIPPSVDQIVLRCLAKSQADRFQSMAELRHALLNPDSYLSSSPPVVASEGASSRVSANHPALTRPVVPENRTMSIETPYGHTGARRGRTLILALVALVSAAGGAAAALVQPAAAEEFSSSADSTESEAAESAAKPAEPNSQTGEATTPDAKDAGAETAGDPDMATKGDAASASASTTVAEKVEPTAALKSDPKKPTSNAKKPKKGSKPKKDRKPKKKKKVGEDTLAPSF